MTKEKREFDKKCFFKILGIVLLFSIGLFPYNYCSDIYNVMDAGFWEYAKEWFAPAGRTVGMGVLFLLEMIQMPINMYIFIMKIFAVFIATYTIYTFYNMILDAIQYKEEKDNIKNKYIFIATIITFLNMASYQFFYYAESAVMWMGVMFTVLAVKTIITDNKKWKYLKTFILLFIAMNCYQSTILFFIPAALLFLGMKKDKVTKIIEEIVKISIIVGICLILGYFTIQGLTEYFKVVPYRNNNISFNNENSLDILYCLITQNINNVGHDFSYLLINIFSILLITVLKNKFMKIRKSILLVIIISIIMSAFIQTWVTISIVDYYVADRIQFAYLSTIGFCTLFFAMYTKMFDYKKITKLCYSFLIFFLFYMIIKSNYISISNKYVNYQSDFEGKTISQAVEKYEEVSGCEITEVIYCHDNYVDIDCKNVKVFGDPTFRIFVSPWVFESALKYYIKKDDIKITQNQYIFEYVFDARNWDEFDERQIKFKDNTMYLCIY